MTRPLKTLSDNDLLRVFRLAELFVEVHKSVKKDPDAFDSLSSVVGDFREITGTTALKYNVCEQNVRKYEVVVEELKFRREGIANLQ